MATMTTEPAIRVQQDDPGDPGVRAAAQRPATRIKTGGLTIDNTAPLIAAAIGSLSLVWLLYERLLPLSGALGFWLCWYVGFLALYAVAIGRTSGRLAMRNAVAGALVTSAALFVASALFFVVIFTAYSGWQAIQHLNFFTETTAYIGPEAALEQGGVLAAMVGTLEQVLIATVITVPLGIMTGIYLNEVKGPFSQAVRSVVDAMSAIPTIVAGLFIFAVVILSMGFERSGFAAALALSVEMLPVVTRTSEVVLRLVPNGLREASYALGSTQWRTVWRVVLPTARSGLVTAVLLGVARVIGETSPVLLTAGFTNELNGNPTDGARCPCRCSSSPRCASRSTTRSPGPSVPPSSCWRSS
jgi:phosphate transport system permease protein